MKSLVVSLAIAIHVKKCDNSSKFCAISDSFSSYHLGGTAY